MLESLQQVLPIVLLIGAIVFVLRRLPKVDLGHSDAYLRRRRFNWLPLGLTYAFLYMGRYNLTVAKNALGERLTNDDFATIFFWGTLTYGVSFLLNGPLTDKLGGRATILISAIGSAAMNLAMGLLLYLRPSGDLVVWFSVLYSANMYFQSFGAVSIVKVNSHWFHVRERGTFGGIFGILISLGVYFAYDWGRLIVEHAPTVQWVFYVPAAVLVVFAVIDYFVVFDRPSQAGLADIETGDASSGTSDAPESLAVVAKRMFSNPVIVTIALVELCSGYLRQAIMQWYPVFAKQTRIDDFVAANWGLLLCVAGITGGVFAGVISDRIFGSRRGPVAAVLYAIMVGTSLLGIFLLESPLLGWVMIFASMAVIGVHGMLSGTASMDFGGKKNAGVAVGIIDGFVYLGTAIQFYVMRWAAPAQGVVNEQGVVLSSISTNWKLWPIVMLPAAVLGLVLALRLWNARPKPRAPTPVA